MPPLLEFRGVGLSFGEHPLFSGVSFTVDRGEGIAVAGHEGSGKTSLLKLCLGMILPTEGSVLIDGRDTRNLRGREWRALRARIGFIQQAGGLMANLSILDNILLPLRYHNLWDASLEPEIGELAWSLDLGPHLARFPGELPESVQKRARLARAIALRPRLILADHPLAGVSEDVAETIAGHLSAARGLPSCAVVATSHTLQGARRLAQTAYLLDNGRLSLA